MDMMKRLIQKKPLIFLLISCVYLVSIVLLKWWMHPSLDMLWFLIGGAIGIYFLDGAELFFQLNPSPFRTTLFFLLFSVVSLFVVTSSGSALACGLVLSLYAQMLMRYIGVWLITHVHPAMLIVYCTLFILESFIFTR